MAGTSNSFYGHRAILAEYVGLRRERPILGYLQHGWHHGWPEWHSGEPHYARLPRAIPKLMWSEADVDAVLVAGARPVWGIGAPFLYLLQMRGFAEPPGDGSLLCFPSHASEIGLVDTDWNGYCDHVAALAESRRVTICLHPAEHSDQGIKALLRSRGFEVTTNGSRDDPRFLYRLAELVEAHDEVSSNRLGTAIVYGGAMRRRILVSGPIPGLTVDSTGRPLVAEARLMDAFQREHYPELLAGLGHLAAERFAREELGASAMLEPEHLSEALGWRGRRRIQGGGIALLAGLRRGVMRPTSRVTYDGT